MSKNPAIPAIHAFGKALGEIANNQTFTVEPNLQEKIAIVASNGEHVNPWFTEENVHFAMRHWSGILQPEELQQWLGNYKPVSSPKKIGLITAGNIPLVGLHDILCVWAAGHHAHIKHASDDPLTREIIPLLQYIAGDEQRFVRFGEMLKNADAYIATGSNNSARYFDYYFGKYPHIIRKNRNSVAIITGRETEAEMQGLAEDIFLYFGQGCRSVSKVYIPEDFDVQNLFKAFYGYKEIGNHHRYGNNYDYYRTIYIMSRLPVWDNGFLILKEDEGLSSPVAVLFYERYKDEVNLRANLAKRTDDIQCIVSQQDLAFGTTQKPGLADYADNIDTMAFLTNL
ncbi:MAG: acyl-CoA reductase [Cryomorphaceae bacterium]|nr:acyl-CoA reductase [Cryomorphaceae bacterium]